MLRSGREARAFRDDKNRRVYGPFCVEMEVQMSPLAVTSDTLKFYVYQETGDAAIDRAGYFLQMWYVADNPARNGFPKPVGQGRATPISDQEYRMTWQQAVQENKEVLRANDQQDPLGFHIRPTSRIILPTTRFKP